MSNTNNYETGYQDDDATQQATAVDDASGFSPETTSAQSNNKKNKASKKGSKLPLIIFGVVAVLGLGGAGAYLMLGDNNPPAPKQRPAAQAPAVEEAKAEEASSDQQQASTAEIDPITGLPVDQNIGAELDPITGLPVAAAAPTGELDPITGLPVSPATAPSVDVDTSTAPQAIEAPSVDPLMAGANSQPTVDPLAGIPAQQPQAVNNVGGADPLAAFRDMLAPIDSRVTTLEKDVASLRTSVEDIKSKVDRLLDRPTSNAVSTRSTSTAPRRKAATQSAPRRQAANNYVRSAEANPRVEPPVSRVVIVPSAHHETVPSVHHTAEHIAPQTSTVSSSSLSCDLQAIVPGRVWVKNADGSFASYGEGETWGGKTVGTIDPARGVEIGGRWICN